MLGCAAFQHRAHRDRTEATEKSMSANFKSEISNFKLPISGLRSQISKLKSESALRCDLCARSVPSVLKPAGKHQARFAATCLLALIIACAQTLIVCAQTASPTPV